MERGKILEDRMDFATEKNDADSTEDQDGQDQDYDPGTDYSLDSDYSIDSDDMYRLYQTYFNQTDTSDEEFMLDSDRKKESDTGGGERPSKRIREPLNEKTEKTGGSGGPPIETGEPHNEKTENTQKDNPDDLDQGSNMSSDGNYEYNDDDLFLPPSFYTPILPCPHQGFKFGSDKESESSTGGTKGPPKGIGESFNEKTENTGETKEPIRGIGEPHNEKTGSILKDNTNDEDQVFDLSFEDDYDYNYKDFKSAEAGEMSKEYADYIMRGIFKADVNRI